MSPNTPSLCDAALARRLVQTQFPQWGGLPVRPVAEGGQNNLTFRLGAHLLIRLPSAERYVAQVAKEQAWLPRLAPHLPLPIPRPIALGAPGDGFRWPWSIYDWIIGDVARPERIRDPQGLAEDLAGFLLALQAIDPTDGPAAGAHNFHRGGALAVYDAETRAAIAGLGDEIDAPAALAIWDAALASAWDAPPVWIHGDVAPGNLLLRAGRLCAVIDFGNMGVGDPACDLVPAWTMFDPPARQRFRNSLALDPGTWDRARGWALWKALITWRAPDPAGPAARRVVAALLAERGCGYTS
ncbi:aminoglycoside phosphotransferase family protein [Roseomonas frigidaquae]|uniref:Aminoglycoside phosphotransferase family protein n=1 Tax=Falsiroseomonas frigidaquae TaxID=487318 RepID=A0ABX1F8G8_9PROT|nr:aminoglycoside phosphotransferase family protein [Falsiroseomonas frigidaquae]NKE48711.1 aminoglycoside phosphotransferase family protein [Falsiroseomonas frigidaquae]